MRKDIFSSKGIKVATVKLPDWKQASPSLLAQAIRVYASNSKAGLASVKTRGEVRISKRKIYRQKGTGGARHGAKSAPIFVGGGVAHGPRPGKRILSLPKRLKGLALSGALWAKAEGDEIAVIRGLSKVAKTADAKRLLLKLAGVRGQKTEKITFVLPSSSGGAFRNIAGAKVKQFVNLNAADVFFGGYLIFDEGVFLK